MTEAPHFAEVTEADAAAKPRSCILDKGRSCLRGLTFRISGRGMLARLETVAVRAPLDAVVGRLGIEGTKGNAMGQAKQRGTYAERVQQATSRAVTAAAEKRAAAFEKAQAIRRASIDSDGPAVVVRGGSDRRANNALISAALVAALAFR